MLIALALTLSAAECATTGPPIPPGETRALPTTGPLDAEGNVDRERLAALIEDVERARGLRFIRRPDLAVEAPGPLPRPDEPAAIADHDHARIVARPDADAQALRLAAAALLDGQHYPALVRVAPTLSGDGGVAVRALLVASAQLTASGGRPSPFTAEPPERLSLPLAALAADVGPEAQAGVAAAYARGLLASLDDPEAAFRSPPLSTQQLISPRAYVTSVRPRRLIGPAPTLPGCAQTLDESVGVLRLALAQAHAGQEGAFDAVTGWTGDRIVTWRCDGGRAAWIYVLDASDEAAAKAFLAHADALVPDDWPRPFASARRARRTVLWHDADGATALAFGEALREREVRSLADLAAP